MLVHNSSHITVTEIAFRARISKATSLFLSCRHCHFSGWLLDFAGSVWCTYDSICLLMPDCTQNASLLLIAANKMTDWQLQAALHSLFFFPSPSLLPPVHSSLPSLPRSWLSTSTWTISCVPFMISVNSHFIPVSCWTSNLNPLTYCLLFPTWAVSLSLLALTARFATLSGSVLKDVNHLFLFSQGS